MDGGFPLLQLCSKKVIRNLPQITVRSVLLVDHMDKFGLFSNRQFGFMGGRSTSLQLLKVLEKLTKVIDDGGILHAVYMDFMKVFDKVPHNRLLHKVRHWNK